MKVKDVLNFELDKSKKSSLQTKAVKALVVFLILMFLLTVIARAADSVTITKVTTTQASGMAISHTIETDGNVSSVKDIAVTTVPNIRIEQVLAEEGKTVKKGADLLVLNKEDVDKQIKSCQKEVDAANKAIAQAEKAKESALKAKENAKKERAKAIARAREDYNDTVKAAKKALSRAKKERNAAKKAYQKYKKKKKKTSSSSDDSNVADTLKKTQEEKQKAYDKAVSAYSGLEKDIEAEVQDAIKDAGTDLSQEEKQEIRDTITNSDKNKKLLKEAQKKVDDAREELDEAKTAVENYADEQALLSKQSYKERLKALKKTYSEKKAAYSEAKSSYNQTVKDAKRTLNDTLNQSSEEEEAEEETEDEDDENEDDEDDLADKQKALKAAQQLKENGSKVKAPSDGLITKVNVDVGDTTSDDAVIRMSDKDSGFMFTGTLEKSSAKYLSKGDKVTIEFSNGVNVQNLKIASIEVSSGDRSSYDIKVAIPAKVKKITTFASFKADKASKKYDTCVPLGCLHSNGSDYYVYTVTETKSVLGIETKVDKVSVSILDKNTEYAAIDGVFNYDQQFVLTSSKTLSDKDRVKIVKEDDSSDEEEEDLED